MFTAFQLFYIHGAVASAILLLLEHLFCKSSFSGDDLIIVVFWPYFAVVAIGLFFKGIYNIVKNARKARR